MIAMEFLCTGWYLPCGSRSLSLFGSDTVRNAIELYWSASFAHMHQDGAPRRHVGPPKYVSAELELAKVLRANNE